MSYDQVDFISTSLPKAEDSETKLHFLNSVLENIDDIDAPETLLKPVFETALTDGDTRVRTRAFNAYRALVPKAPQSALSSEHFLKVKDVSLDETEDVDVRFVALRAFEHLCRARPDLVTEESIAGMSELATKGDLLKSLARLAEKNVNLAMDVSQK